MWPEPPRTLLSSVVARHPPVVHYPIRTFPLLDPYGFFTCHGGCSAVGATLLALQKRPARSVIRVPPLVTTDYAFAAFSAEAQPARSPLLIARAIISGKASGVQANDGIPIAARLPATSWL